MSHGEYREAVTQHSPGSAAKPRHPGKRFAVLERTLKGFHNRQRHVVSVDRRLCNPFGVEICFSCQPRVRSLRSRPQALLCNAFGVEVLSDCMSRVRVNIIETKVVRRRKGLTHPTWLFPVQVPFENGHLLPPEGNGLGIEIRSLKELRSLSPEPL